MIYLDNNATTAPLPQVVDAVTDALRENWGNPSSSHAPGRRAREALEKARVLVAQALGAQAPSCITFTASGTESINLACACLLSVEIKRVLVASTEHSAVLHAVERWAEGRPVISIPVDSQGGLDLNALDSELKKGGRSLVCVALANNETGVITEVASVAALCREHDALLHVDAVQAAGKIPLSLQTLQCDAASLSAHKFHGPPGCGILYLKSCPNLDVHRRLPAWGHQEAGLRGGTENLPAIVGCGVAAGNLDAALAVMPKVAALRDELEQALLEVVPGSEIHCSMAPRLPNTTSVYVPRRSSADLVETLSALGVAVSAGAACSNGTAPSHVIRAMGYSEARANSTLRFSLSRFTTNDEMLRTVRQFARAYATTMTLPPCT